MFTVELRFKESGREVSFDWLVDEFASKFARVLKEQIVASKNEAFCNANEVGSRSREHHAPHVEGERPTPKAVGINEAARLLGIRPSTLRVRVQQGKIRIVRIGRRVLVPMESIERVVREGIPGRS
jgi:excisionase family DNA binding protein